MTTHVEDDSETATEARKSVPPLDSDDNTRDNKSSPCSSPPPVNKNFSFKPFAMSRAQKRTIAENASRESSTTATRTTSVSEDRQTGSTGGQAENKLAEKARGNKTLDSMDLKSLIDTAKQKALAKNKPKKAERVAELYERSLNDERLTVLLETALRTNATPEQQHELQQYIDGTKTIPDVSLDTMPSLDTTPKDVTTIEPDTAMIDPVAQTSNILTKVTTANIPQPTEPIDPELLATFCATQLWPRYCRLPPGPNTSFSFKTFTSSTINDRGQTVPKIPAPSLWLDEVTAELSFLLDMTRVERSAWIRTLMEKPGYASQDVHALLAEEVRWATHNGPYKKREMRRKIGVLLECAGIERKGAFWYPTKTQ